jgi:hypothetical protein
VAFTTWLSIGLFFASGVIAVLLAEGNAWIQQNRWLGLSLIAGAVISGVAAIFSAKWFQRLIGQRQTEQIGQKAIHQESRGAFSPTIAIGSAGDNVTVTVASDQKPASPREQPPKVLMDIRAGCFVLTNSGSEAFNIEVGPIYLAPFKPICFEPVFNLASGETKPLVCVEIGASDGAGPTDEWILRMLSDTLGEHGNDEDATWRIIIDYLAIDGHSWRTIVDLTYDRKKKRLGLKFVGHAPVPPKVPVLQFERPC